MPCKGVLHVIPKKRGSIWLVFQSSELKTVGGVDQQYERVAITSLNAKEETLHLGNGRCTGDRVRDFFF